MSYWGRPRLYVRKQSLVPCCVLLLNIYKPQGLEKKRGWGSSLLLLLVVGYPLTPTTTPIPGMHKQIQKHQRMHAQNYHETK
jgi:hypothetical protein